VTDQAANGHTARRPREGRRLVLLVTAPSVRPGLLSWRAWQALAGAARVLAPSAGHPLLPALEEAGIGWTVLPGDTVLAGDQDVLAGGDDAAGTARRLARAVAGETGPGSAGPGSAGTVVWLCPPEPPGRPADVTPGPLALASELGGRDGPPDTAVELLYGSSPLPGGELLTLVSVMDTLRRRCPWDARQTHESLAPYLLEESYEALDALESGDRAALREELGDVLLQVMFHARVAAERTDGTGFTVDDVADGIVTKLVRRHPHVFAGVPVSGADEVTRNWDEIKAAERAAGGGPASALDGVPPGQPALALAAQLQRRAGRAGAPAELATLEADDGDEGRRLGAELFALVARARAAGLDPELELRAAARRFGDRVRAWEQRQGAGAPAGPSGGPAGPPADQAG
jgi:XTP/dITP diphosphohydrolase